MLKHPYATFLTDVSKPARDVGGELSQRVLQPGLQAQAGAGPGTRGEPRHREPDRVRRPGPARAYSVEALRLNEAALSGGALLERPPARAGASASWASSPHMPTTRRDRGFELRAGAGRARLRGRWRGGRASRARRFGAQRCRQAGQLPLARARRALRVAGPRRPPARDPGSGVRAGGPRAAPVHRGRRAGRRRGRLLGEAVAILGVGRVGLSDLVDGRLLGPLEVAEPRARAGHEASTLEAAAAQPGE